MVEAAMVGASPEGAVRFARSLYAGDAVRAAVQAFDGFATLTVREEADGWLVTVADPDPRHADVLADELANFALAETVTAHREGAVRENAVRENAASGGTA